MLVWTCLSAKAAKATKLRQDLTHVSKGNIPNVVVTLYTVKIDVAK